MRVIVVGCGVSGLSSAIRLTEAEHEVAIWAKDLPPYTTSNVAAATWYPYRAFPVERVLAWGQRAFEVFTELAEAPESGVSFIEALELFREEAPDPWWRECVTHFRRASPAELPPGFVSGYVFETPVIEMPVYLPYLMRRFEALGGRATQREIAALEEALAESDVVVNCSGLGALTLVGDEEVYPLRGQIVRVEPPPVGRILINEDELAYIVPRSRDCVLGGTADAGNWSLEPDMEVAEAIIERCARLAPEVRQARVVEHLVGLRPARNAIRLEAEPQGLEGTPGKLVVHNYGHGGAGVTLSWGCAEEVVRLVAAHSTLEM